MSDVIDPAPEGTPVDDVQYVDGPAGCIGYRRKGSGEPLLLLHPLALSGRVWASFADRLAAHYDVISPDSRGHGSSGWDGAPFGIADLADDIVVLLDALGLDAAHLLGMSMGGSVAMDVAGRYPDRVDRLVLADTTAWYGDDAPHTWKERAQRAQSVSRRSQVPFQVDRWFTEQFRRTRADEVRRVTSIFIETDSAAHAQACLAFGAMDGRGLLGKVTAPTLSITGEEDYATPSPMGAYAAEHVVDGVALTLPGLRHLSLVERPELADLVSAHLEGESLPTHLPGLTCGCRPQGPNEESAS